MQTKFCILFFLCYNKDMEKKEKLVLIDGNSLINRAFYALPLLSNSQGEYSNAVYGFCNILIKLIEAEKPKYMAVAFDMGYPTFRHEMYSEYKAGRKGMPAELASQLPILKQVLQSMGIMFVEQKGIEADDIIGTLAKKFYIETIVVSGDRDLFQLVDDTTKVWFTKRGISDIIAVTPQNIEEVYGVKQSQVTELKALMGDTSDNIKGVAGVGEKTAKALLNEYGNLENLYENINNIKGKLQEKLLLGKQDAFLSRTLATINTNVTLNINLEELQYNFPFDEQTLDLFKKYEFNSITKRQDLFSFDTNIKPVKQVNTKQIEMQSQFLLLLESLKQVQEFAVVLNDKSLHIASSKFEENIINFSENFTPEFVLQSLKEILENSNIKKSTLNSKKLKAELKKYNISLSGVELDCNLAKYLLSGSQKTDVDAITFASENNYEAQNIACAVLSQKQTLFDELEKNGMSKLYFDVELPLVDVLLDMEENGFKIDLNSLEILTELSKAEIENLTQKIYQCAGMEFNIKSPKQLGEVLFEKLMIKLPKNMKKSTSADVLEKIANQHEIVDLIMRFRKIEKLYNTYLEPFKNLTDKQTGLIHTIFNQTLTSTGRLSSSEPNLQNIPVRDEEGKLLRKVFVPREKNGSIVTSDYSQIELRLLAHYSQDEKLMYAYQNNLDIHTQTACDIFGLPTEFITPEFRRRAKTINFGIIYGMSDYGLSVSLNTSRKEAKEIIDKYFESYAKVKQYIDGSVDKAREHGFVTTLLGRKRIIQEINSPNHMTKQFGERAAMNMPLQGTASDLIKVAMIKVYNALKSQNLKSKLILQIHDELIVDCAEGEEEAVCKILKENMENAIELSVPLVVDVKVGKNWFEAK